MSYDPNVNPLTQVSGYVKKQLEEKAYGEELKEVALKIYCASIASNASNQKTPDVAFSDAKEFLEVAKNYKPQT